MDQAMGAIFAAIIAAIVSVIAAWITAENSISKIKLETSASYRSELAKRQLDACEAFWEIFGTASMTDGKHRIIKDFESKPVLDINETENFIEKFQEVFNSKAGLYLSKSTRTELHAFRDILIKLRDDATKNPEKTALTHELAAEVKELRTKARLALRTEIGTTNLTVGNKEYKSY